MHYQLFLATLLHAKTHSHKTILRMYTRYTHLLHYTGSSSNCSSLKNLVHGFSLCSAATRAETSARVCVKIATSSAVETRANWATVRPRWPLNHGHVASAAMQMSACFKGNLPLLSPSQQAQVDAFVKCLFPKIVRNSTLCGHFFFWLFFC